VELLEGKDGKPVDDHAGRLRISRHAGLGRVECGDERLVHFLDEIIPLLVEAVDGALGLVDALRAEIITPGDVFLMPEQEIPQVVFLHEAEKFLTRSSRFILMPKGSEGGLKGGDIVRVEVHRLADKAITVAGTEPGGKPA
jgi:hypothetical protein